MSTQAHAHLEIARNILAQLGGRNRFAAMTGAKNFVALESGIQFSLPAYMTKGGINKVVIALTAGDEYNLEFYKIRGTSVRKVAQVNDVQVGELRQAFTEQTNLEVSL